MLCGSIKNEIPSIIFYTYAGWTLTYYKVGRRDDTTFVSDYMNCSVKEFHRDITWDLKRWEREKAFEVGPYES